MFESTELQQPKQPLSSGCSVTLAPDALAHTAVELSAKKRRKVSKLEPQARDSQLCQRPCGQAAARRSSTGATASCGGTLVRGSAAISDMRACSATGDVHRRLRVVRAVTLSIR